MVRRLIEYAAAPRLRTEEGGTDVVDAAVADMRHQITVVVQTEAGHRGARLLGGVGIYAVEGIVSLRETRLESRYIGLSARRQIIAQGIRRRHACHLAVVVASHPVAQDEHVGIRIGLGGVEVILLIILAPYLREAEGFSDLDHNSSHYSGGVIIVGLEDDVGSAESHPVAELQFQHIATVDRASV